MSRLRLALAVLALCAAAPLAAQTQTERAPGATLRMLDKVSGNVTDLRLLNGDETRIGRLVVRLGDCRFPPGNIQGEAYAWLDVTEEDREIFSGWMIASSPALNPMDHARYDIWVLRCNNS
jgi:hypothetical protein